MSVRILTHHYGIVHNHPQRHDQRKQGDHVDGATNKPKHTQSRKKGRRNSHRHPECHSPRKEQIQQAHNQDQAAEAVAGQKGNAVVQKLPGLIVNLQLYRRWQCCPCLVEPLLQNLCRSQGITVFRTLQLQLNGRKAVAGESNLTVPILLAHSGNISKPQLRAFTAENRHRFERLRAAPLLYRPQLSGRILLGHYPRGQIP